MPPKKGKNRKNQDADFDDMFQDAETNNPTTPAVETKEENDEASKEEAAPVKAGKKGKKNKNKLDDDEMYAMSNQNAEDATGAVDDDSSKVEEAPVAQKSKKGKKNKNKLEDDDEMYQLENGNEEDSKPDVAAEEAVAAGGKLAKKGKKNKNKVADDDFLLGGDAGDGGAENNAESAGAKEGEGPVDMEVVEEKPTAAAAAKSKKGKKNKNKVDDDELFQAPDQDGGEGQEKPEDVEPSEEKTEKKGGGKKKEDGGGKKKMMMLDSNSEDDDDGGHKRREMKSAAEKKAEKKKRDAEKRRAERLKEEAKFKELAEKQKKEEKEKEKQRIADELAAKEKELREAEEKAAAAGEVADGEEEAKGGEDAEGEDGEEKKTKKKKDKGGAMRKALREEMERKKAEEERIRQLEEEQAREEERLRKEEEERVRLENERREQSKMQKREKIAKMKAEGTYLSRAQKDQKARLDMARAQFMAQSEALSQKKAEDVTPQDEKVAPSESKAAPTEVSKDKRVPAQPAGAAFGKSGQRVYSVAKKNTKYSSKKQKEMEEEARRQRELEEERKLKEKIEEEQVVLDNWDDEPEEDDDWEKVDAEDDVAEDSKGDKTDAAVNGVAEQLKNVNLSESKKAELAKIDLAKAALAKVAPAHSVPAAKITAVEDDESDESDDESSSEDESGNYTKEEIVERIKLRRELSELRREVNNPRCAVVCVLGHVDTGKTKILDKIRRTNVQDGEAGGITQQIGATNMPQFAITEWSKSANVKEFEEEKLKLPGFLVIDTPGHESFTNLRTRGSSLCDLAILVVDIMHGLEPQTLESIQLLKNRQAPFVIALNKIDRLFEWKSNAQQDIRKTINKQKKHVKDEFEDRLKKVTIEFAEKCEMNVCPFWENDDPANYVSICPTSAHTGDGMGNMIWYMVNFCQTYLRKRLAFRHEPQATVLEVKEIQGLGTTIDVILVNGKLREGQPIVVAGYEGPIQTTIKALLMPPVMKELRVKNQYDKVKSVTAATGIKILAKDVEKALAGMPMLVAKREDESEVLVDEMESTLKSMMSSIKTSKRGVYVQASTLGSLEALLEFLKSSSIPYSDINIGPVHRKDVMKATTMLQNGEELYGVILAFDVKVERDAQELADSSGIRIFTADIIYHLFDKFMAYKDELKQKAKDKHRNIAIFPCKLRILPNCIFNKRDPIIIGIVVEAGIVKVGTQLCVPTKEGIVLGTVASLEINNKPVEFARQGSDVCLKIENTTGEAPKLYGRHFDANDLLVSKLSRDSIDALKDHFRDEMQKNDWVLVKELKSVFKIV